LSRENIYGWVNVIVSLVSEKNTSKKKKQEFCLTYIKAWMYVPGPTSIITTAQGLALFSGKIFPATIYLFLTSDAVALVSYRENSN